MSSPLRAVLTGRAWAAHLALVVSLLIAVLLGAWQWGAWQAHRAAAERDVTHAAPQPLDRLLGPDAPLTGNASGHPVTITGHWLPDETVEITGRGAGGSWLVTPVETAGGSAIPVVRGWRARHTPDPAAPTGAVTLVGWLQPSEDDPTASADPDPDDTALSQLRIADLVQRVDVDLYGAYAVLDHQRDGGPGGSGLHQARLDQQPDAGSWAGARNLFYALEWWFFGCFAAFLWWRWVRDEWEAADEQAPTHAVPSST